MKVPYLKRLKPDILARVFISFLPNHLNNINVLNNLLSKSNSSKSEINLLFKIIKFPKDSFLAKIFYFRHNQSFNLPNNLHYKIYNGVKRSVPIRKVDLESIVIYPCMIFSL